MRAACAAVLAAALTSTTLAQQFPYEAYVTAAAVNVRAVPDRQHQPTDVLPAGSKVTVYRHHGEYAAIRPPEGSFSWVAAQFVKRAGEKLGEITVDGVTAWVGTKLSDRRLAAQVKLKAGEKVAILGIKEVTTVGGQSSVAWYKIAPPSGEFRYVPLLSISRARGTVPSAGAPATETTPSRQPISVAPAGGPTGVDGSQVEPAAGEQPAKTGWKSAPSNGHTIHQGGQTARVDSDRPAHERKDFPYAGAISKSPFKEKLDRRGYQQRLRQLDLELSLMVAKSPGEWKLDGLRKRAQQLHDAGQTALDRGRTRALLDKIGRFEDLKVRHDRLSTTPLPNRTPAEPRRLNFGPTAPTPATTAQSTTPAQPGPGGNRQQLPMILPPPSSSPPTRAPSGNPTVVPVKPRWAFDPRFDGVGQLEATLSQQPGVPPYMLLDGRGNVAQLITPGPGVDLRPFIHKRIGVYGQRGYIPQYNKHHLTAERVVPLSLR